MSKREAENSKLSLPVSESRDHIQGPITAPVTLVEYGDYECPSKRSAITKQNQVSKIQIVSLILKETLLQPK